MSLAPLNASVPQARPLSNGRYTVLMSAAGTGYPAWNWNVPSNRNRNGDRRAPACVAE
jgi:hypothetical protein